MTEMEERIETALRKIDPDMMPSMYGRMARAAIEAMPPSNCEKLKLAAINMINALTRKGIVKLPGPSTKPVDPVRLGTFLGVEWRP